MSVKTQKKKNTKLTLKISSNIVGHSNDGNYFPHKLFLTNSQVSKLCIALANTSSANIKLSKTQLLKTGHSEEFLGELLGPLLKARLPLTGNVLKPLPKRVLIPLGLTPAGAATDAAIHRKMFGTDTKKLIMSNKRMNDIMKIVKSLEESGLLIKSVSETIKIEAKEEKKRFLGM